MLLALMTSLALILSGAAILFFRTEGESLLRTRKALFWLGLIANAGSTVVLLVFLAEAYKVAHGTVPVDLDRVYPVFWLLGLGGLAVVLAFFGRRFSRVLLVAAGLLTVCSWYLALLATSP
jgi:hypothetical protein